MKDIGFDFKNKKTKDIHWPGSFSDRIRLSDLIPDYGYYMVQFQPAQRLNRFALYFLDGRNNNFGGFDLLSEHLSQITALESAQTHFDSQCRLEFHDRPSLTSNQKAIGKSK